jgi:phosphoglycerate dehydrogenase-like enzyme
MADIRAALVTLSWKGPLLDAVRSALEPAEIICVNPRNRIAINKALEHVDVAILEGDLDARFTGAPALRWIHCGHAGLERSATAELFDSDLIVTSAAGRSAPALAEHAMFFMLALSFRSGQFHEAQRKRIWGVPGQGDLRALHGQTLGILGLGHTGSELARRATAFGMHVLAYRRGQDGSDHVDQIYSAERGDSLESLLRQSDYLVLSLPLNDHTHQLIGARELAAMKPSASLINIGRGGLVDEAALIQALNDGQIGGAAIDVAQQEPLPRSSPLWNTPNLLITPHFTPRLEDRDERALDILLQNVRRYRNNEPLLNQLRPADQFSNRLAEDTAPSSRTGLSLGQRTSHLARKVLHRWRTR